MEWLISKVLGYEYYRPPGFGDAPEDQWTSVKKSEVMGKSVKKPEVMGKSVKKPEVMGKSVKKPEVMGKSDKKRPV
ncbi:hypothetical protein V6N13_084915 [Hibiscus sabdariffa]|uniref:Uncharacterized protein n=1 Tax=Hibiscus sabdariffa TaxID=183260 RepID=A0ABR2CZX7_9ROSI